MTALPQVMVNVSVRDKTGACESPAVVAAVEDAEERLAGQGRVLLRPSGTEQLVRVMVEAPTVDLAESLALGVADVVTSVSR
jgi:phosphoglucosamine mutase